MLSTMDDTPLYRVRFDTNERVSPDAYSLAHECSMADLAKIGDELREGMRVIIWMPDELEMEAALGFDHTYCEWYAEGDHSTIKHYY